MAAFFGAMIGSKLPFLGELGWSGFLNGSVWFMDGKTMLGGIFGGYAAVEVTKETLGIKESTGDTFALPVALSVLIGRIGCYVAGCCYGTETTLPWGVAFDTDVLTPGAMRHPTQVYEALFHGIAAILLLVAAQFNWLTGQRLKAYLLAYLVFRFITEWIRPAPVSSLGLTLYQWSCLILAGLLGVLWYRDSIRCKPDNRHLDADVDSITDADRGQTIENP